jgi:NADPH:quinone reductase-like Zn-dependent oxidoreductase
MRGVQLVGNGGFEQLVVRDDLPVPVPAAHEVLVRVGAAAVNNTDVNTRIGWYTPSVTSATPGTGEPDDEPAAAIGWSGDAPAFPRIQGADACGRIVEVGAEVDPGRSGERVLVEPVLRGRPGTADRAITYFGSECDGAFAEYAVAPSVHCHRVVSELGDVELATFPCSSSAAENMVVRAAVGPGDVVLVTGASGGVGTAAVQLARRRGARVVAVAGADKAAAVLALGAAEVLPREVDLRAVLGPRSVDVVIDVVGGDGWPTLLDVLRPFGRLATAGAIAGPVVELDLRTLYLKDLTLVGCTVLAQGVFAGLVGHIERGEVQPVVAATYPLEEIVAAQRRFLAKDHVGKVVLTVTG